MLITINCITRVYAAKQHPRFVASLIRISESKQWLLWTKHKRKKRTSLTFHCRHAQVFTNTKNIYTHQFVTTRLRHQYSSNINTNKPQMKTTTSLENNIIHWHRFRNNCRKFQQTIYRGHLLHHILNKKQHWKHQNFMENGKCGRSSYPRARLGQWQSKQNNKQHTILRRHFCFVP